MSKQRKAGGNPARQSWDPITVVRSHPDDAQRLRTAQHGMAAAFYSTGGMKHHYNYRYPQPATQYLAFRNRLYDGAGLVFEDGSMHLSFKRRDRAPVRDWRHFQAIKNEVAGIEREAIEIYPPESELMDAANEYHLWVLPPNSESPLGLRGRGVGAATDTTDHARYRQGGAPGTRQRDWEPGIPTGMNLEQGGTDG